MRRLVSIQESLLAGTDTAHPFNEQIRQKHVYHPVFRQYRMKRGSFMEKELVLLNLSGVNIMDIEIGFCVITGVSLYFGMVRPVLWRAGWI
jgi:hypothetical protein